MVASHSNSIATNDTNIGLLQSKASQLQANLATLGGYYADMEDDISDINSSLSTLSLDLAELEGVVDDLSIGSSDSSYVLVYDKDSLDPSIHLNKQNGILLGTSFALDLTSYTYLRVYFYMGGSGAQTYIKLTDRKTADQLVVSCAASLSTYHTVRLIIPTNRSRLSAEIFNSIEIDSEGNVTKTLRGNESNFYIYRIEGYL